MKMDRQTICIILALALSAASAAGQDAPSAGTLSFDIRDSDGQLMPGKLVVLNDASPVDLSVPYDGGHTATYDATVYTASGTGSVTLPPGAYEVWAGRGLEYSADVHEIEIRAGETSSLSATLVREVHTPGFIGADMHVHVEHVEHLEERVISLVGEGLEWAVSTEHNVHVDYRPAVDKLGLGSRLLTTVGNEVTTSIGHFNSFPLDPDSPPVDHRLLDAHELFRSMRDAPGETIIQVNHPRWDGGAYFTVMDVSPASGLTSRSSYSESFDSFELLNENRGFGWTAEPPNNSYSVRKDWYHYLNRGIRKPVVGNSDSHAIADMLVGVPRNYIASTTDDPAGLTEEALVDAIQKGRVTVNRGLYVEAWANGAGVGEMTSLRDGAVELRVRVQAPGWIESDSVEIIANGKVAAALTPSRSGSVRLDTTLTFRPQKDTWYVVTAVGSKPMRPLVHDVPVPITPLGVTNAVWVDADDDGHFTSLYDEVVTAVDERRDDPQTLIDQLAADSLMLAFATGYLMTDETDRATEILQELLPHATLHERLQIYRRLSTEDSERAIAVLEQIAEAGPEQVDRAAAALQLAKLGRKPFVRRLMEYAQTMDQREMKTLDFTWLERGRPITDWRIAGPFPFDGAHGLDDVGVVESNTSREATYTTEENATITWKDVSTADAGIVDLSALFGPVGGLNAYGFAEFESASAGNVLFLLGSDDGVVLWLNDREVHRNDAHRSVDIGDDVLVLPVEKGKNTFLVKVENGSGDWGFGIEIVDLLDVIDSE